MSKILEVYWSERFVGQLIQDDHGELNFRYGESWLSDPAAISISCSLPLREKTFSSKECRGFFQGILPENGNRRLIAKTLGISPNNDFSLLEKIGGECAGALSFISPNIKPSDLKQQYLKLDEKDLAKILRSLPKRPLLAGEEGVRLSLAGVQDKIAVCITEGQVALPLDNSPSTHIIKPAIVGYEGIIFNEAFCLLLANSIGLGAAKASIAHAEDVDYLLVERFDRKITNSSNHKPTIARLHQEDFCQALGIVSERKYQNEGGPSLLQCFSLVQEQSNVPVIDLQRLLDAVIFNFVIGNCDAHGKNFSLILDKEIRLTPFYDLLSTTYYEELSQKMAMKLGGEYKITNIAMKHFEKLATEIDFTKAAVHHRIAELVGSILSALPSQEIKNEVTLKISYMIEAQCNRLLNTL